ncbi:hypothetical protein EC973_004913 [Apophysomyces ossiformis]|uniref:Major facilitator superfamily (MFS) profile domain-containing protein n=1 Tax=Apophysomyces ossiformis TaxID=679940 RepID=A0A8H7BSF1_9FUNG|nr:hypothetical protein EC973_004913 [Apophysomyces ossiformis]
MVSESHERDETSPLLGVRDGSIISYLSDNDDRVTIRTSNPPSIKSNNGEYVEEDLVAKRLNGASMLTLCLGLYIGVSLAALDSSIVATIYAQIGTEFKKSNEIIWIATSYVLSYTALQPLCLWSLVAARAIAGIGGGGINTVTSVIVSDLVPLRERGKFQGFGNIAYGLGSVIGAPLGGLITDTVGWRYCFYINLPLLLVTLYAAVCLLTNYNLEEQPQETLREKLKKIDYLGALTIILGVISFLLATSLGGNLRPWSDPLVVTCLTVSGVLAVTFCIIEKNFAANPLMPWHIISSRSPLACSLTNFWAMMCSTSMVYIIPLYFQGLLGYSPTQGGLYYLPKVIAVSFGSVLSGLYMSRTGEYLTITIMATCGSFLSMIGFATWSTTTPFAFIIACLLLDGFSMGVILTTTLIAMLSCVGQQEMATITSMSYLFRSAGSVIGISSTSAIFQAVVKNVLTERITGPDAAKYIEIARKSMTEIRVLLPPEVLQIVLDTYQIALRYTFLSCVAIASLAVVSSLFIQRFELHTKVRK